MVAATNHERLLDGALWRRFDEVVQFARPDKRQIEELLTRNLRQMHVAPNVVMKSAVIPMSGMAHADIERIVINAIKTTIIKGEEKISSDTLQREIAKQKDRDLAAMGPEMRKRASKKNKLSHQRNASSSKR